MSNGLNEHIILKKEERQSTETSTVPVMEYSGTLMALVSHQEFMVDYNAFPDSADDRAMEKLREILNLMYWGQINECIAELKQKLEFSYKHRGLEMPDTFKGIFDHIKTLTDVGPLKLK